MPGANSNSDTRKESQNLSYVDFGQKLPDCDCTMYAAGRPLLAFRMVISSSGIGMCAGLPRSLGHPPR